MAPAPVARQLTAKHPATTSEKEMGRMAFFLVQGTETGNHAPIGTKRPWSRNKQVARRAIASTIQLLRNDAHTSSLLFLHGFLLGLAAWRLRVAAAFLADFERAAAGRAA